MNDLERFMWGERNGDDDHESRPRGGEQPRNRGPDEPGEPERGPGPDVPPGGPAPVDRPAPAAPGPGGPAGA